MSIESKPRRIQRSRKKGWRMPENAVYVGRPTIWGNPFETMGEFHLWLRGSIRAMPEDHSRRAEILRRLPELKGKNLACWCKVGDCCHADVLLELANKEATL